MERKILILLLSLCALSGCGNRVSETKPANVKPAAPAPATAPSIPKNGLYDGRGEITKINPELGSVELKHEAIKDLMPAMQMEFFVSDRALLKGLALGERVDFVVEYKDPTETIVSIKKAP